MSGVDEGRSRALVPQATCLSWYFLPVTDFDQAFPPLLTKLHHLDFDYDEGNGIDFEPYQEFQSAEDNADWIQAWTGNKSLTGSEYRVFGQDGTGGYAAFWLVRPDGELLAQPIVFFGSEGEVGLVASDFGDYLWLLAGGFGPYEAVAYGDGDDDSERPPSPAFTEFAARHAAAQKKSAREVLDAVRAEFPDFEASIRALCR